MKYGCDPELLLWRGEVYNGEEITNPQGLVPGGIFGIDGAREAAELRPKPAATVEGAVNEIASVLRYGMEYDCKNYSWGAGTGKRYHPIGGHLHLASPDAGTVSYSNFAGLLDTYVGIPMLALEPGRGRNQRRNTGYGSWSDYRDAEWGDGIEYRTTASWLVSPVITRMAFAMAAMIMEHPIPHSIPRRTVLNMQHHMDDTQWLKKEARKSIVEMRTWPHYSQFRHMIEPWHIYDKVLGTWVEERDMRQTWKLLPDSGVEVGRSRSAWQAPRAVTLKSDIQYNASHKGLREMSRSIGPRTSPTRKTIWVTGARTSRGDNYRLSPSLFAQPAVREMLIEERVDFGLWSPFPQDMTGYVVAVPMAARTSTVALEDATEIVSKISDIALDRSVERN